MEEENKKQDVAKVMSKEEKDRIEKTNCENELKQKESELSNRDTTIIQCKARKVLLENSLKMALQEKALQSEECRLIAADPLNFEKRDTWIVHMRKQMNYKLAKHRMDREFMESQFEANAKIVDDQLTRCVDDVPILKKRIKELKRLIEKFK